MITLTDAEAAWILEHIGDEGEASAFQISNMFERKQHAAVVSDFEIESGAKDLKAFLVPVVTKYILEN